MIYRILLTLNLAMVYQNSIAANPASQDWVKGYVAGKYIPLPRTINWPSLCPSGHSLNGIDGCTPDCTDPNVSCPTDPTRGLPRLTTFPSLNNGAVVFQLPQTGVSSNSALRLQTNNLPSNYGYMCQVLNADGSPVTLYALETIPTPQIVATSLINMSGDIVPNGTNISSPLVNSIAQPLSPSNGLWYQNPTNPLYLFCLGYQRTPGSSILRSSPACGGAGSNCLQYSLS